MKKFYAVKSILLFAFAVVNAYCFAQGVGINPAGSLPDASAALDVDFTNKGLLAPRMTASQRTAISSPATGLIVYQTDGTTGFWYNAGTPTSINWVQLVPNPSNSSLNMTSNAITNLPAPVANSDAATKSYVDNAVAAAGGPSWTNFQEFNSAGTFTVPSGITLIKVQVWGGGGGGGAGNSSCTYCDYMGSGGGGGGGYAEGIYTVTPSTPYTVTIGSGGAGGAAVDAAGSNGSASSLGSLISATGGTGGGSAWSKGGQGGWGSGGSINTTLGSGGNGGFHSYYTNSVTIAAQPGTNGGGSAGMSSTGGGGVAGGGGGGGIGGGNGGTGAGDNAIPNSGAGGGGGASTNLGGNGGSGRVVVYW